MIMVTATISTGTASPFPPTLSVGHSLLPLRLSFRPFHGHRRTVVGASPSSFPSRLQRKGMLRVSASGRRRRLSGESFDQEDDDGWKEDEEAMEDNDGEPFDEMQCWLQNKPAGFGEGKTYDTCLENELWKEMEQSRKAQLANKNKLKSGRASKSRGISGTTMKQEPQQQKEIDGIPSGARVRVWNLPKKKNIHRDLQLAFKGFPGLVNISPAVTGNSKTRDPICKGFALLDLDSEEAAHRFVQVFSKKSLLFGKVQKQIICGVVNQHQHSNSSEQSVSDPLLFAELKASDPAIEILSNSLQERTSHDESAVMVVMGSPQEEHASIENQDGLFKHFKKSQTGVGEINLKEQKQRASKKKAGKTMSVKDSKLNIPGSIARLKIKERTALTGVFNKYCRKVAAES